MMNKNYHGRQGGDRLAASGLVHDVVLQVWYQSSAAVDNVETAMPLLDRTAVVL